MPYTMKFIVMVCAAFFARVKPVSTSAKPACMNITRKPATSVQTKLMATVLASMSPLGGLVESVGSCIICTNLWTLCNCPARAIARMETHSCIICTHEHTSCQQGDGESRGSGGAGGGRSVLGQVALDLPFAHSADVFLPFLSLRFDEPLVDVCAHRVPDDIVVLEHVERLVQVAGQLVDAVLPALAKAHLEDVLIHGIGRGQLLLHSVDPCGKLHRKREIGVRRWIRHAQFAAGANAATVGDAHERGAVPHRPRHVGGGLVAGDEPLVAIDE